MNTKYAVQVYETRSINFARFLDMAWRTLAHHESLEDALLHMGRLHGSRAQIIEVPSATPDPYRDPRYVARQGVPA